MRIGAGYFWTVIAGLIAACLIWPDRDCALVAAGAFFVPLAWCIGRAALDIARGK